MKFTKELVEKAFENLGKVPESIHESKRRRYLEVCLRDDCGCLLRILFRPWGNIGFEATIGYRGYFDDYDVKFFESINTTSWDIDFKNNITFNVKINDEKELADVICKVLGFYFYH